jgi:hypothetical protein
MRLPQTCDPSKPRASGISPPHLNCCSGPEGSAQLASNHLADLRASGLTDETIAATRCRTVQGAEVNKVLNWGGGAEKLGQCLYFLYLNRTGCPIGFGRVKPDRPRQEQRADGSIRCIKYEQPRGVGLRIYVPPMVWPLMADPSLPLLVTEGEKKALAAAQLDFAIVGLSGVDCWSKPRPKGPDDRGRGTRELLDDWQAIALRGRVVYVLFDAERPGSTNDAVRAAESASTGSCRTSWQKASASATSWPASACCCWGTQRAGCPAGPTRAAPTHSGGFVIVPAHEADGLAENLRPILHGGRLS